MLIVSGCIVAGLGDLSFSLYGYTLAIACAAMQALYMLLAERLASGQHHEGKAQRAGTHGRLDAVVVGPGDRGAHDKPHKPLGTDACEQLYYMSAVGVPLTLLPLVLSGSASALPSALHAARTSLGAMAFWPWLLSTAVVECVLTGTLLLCTHLNSALTTSIVAVLKSAFAVVLGFFFLGGVRFSWLNVSGIALNLLGGVWYSIAKYRAGGKPGG